MAKLTKLALEQANSALATENAALRKQVADLQLSLEMLPAVPSAPAPRAQPAWQVERAKCMAAARALAMQHGCIVKV